MNIFTRLSGIALCVAISGPLSAQANLLTNGGLEVTPSQIITDPTLIYPDGLIHASSVTHSTALTGWTIGGASIDIVPNTYWGNTEGTYSVDMIGTTGIGSLTQTVTGLTPGNVYELSFDFAVDPSAGGHGGETAFTKWLQVSIPNSDVPVYYFSGTNGTRTVGNMQYIRRAVDFTAFSTSTTIGLAAIMPAGLPTLFPDGTPILPNTLYSGVVLDNVDLEPFTGSGIGRDVPEPASLSLLGLGGIMLLRRRSLR